MGRYTLTREAYIRKGARKVTHKFSDAVAYVYTNKAGRPCAMIFYGAQAKPVANFHYRSEADRERSVRTYFENRQAAQQRVAERRGERKAFVHAVQLGDIYRTCWGYDQTNVEFFEVTALVGKKMVELREIATVTRGDGQGSERCVPQSGAYLAPRHESDDRGVPIRRLIQEHGIKIDEVRIAWPWGKRVAGVVIGEPVHQTALGWGH
jgi:hypothetical protein